MTTPDDVWDELFDELYLTTYSPRLDDADAPAEAAAAAVLAGVEPPAEILDAPTGFGRHARPLAVAGFRVTGVDRSDVQLAEARRLAGDVEWPRWVQADVRELPFDEDAFNAVLCLFSSIGYRGEEGDRRAFAEYLRVLRRGGALVIETMHRDRLMAVFREREWDPLADGAIVVQEHRFDHVTGEMDADHVLIADGRRRGVTYRLRVYTATELVKLLTDTGFTEIECFGDLEGGPLSRETRLVVRASKPS